MPALDTPQLVAIAAALGWVDLSAGPQRPEHSLMLTANGGAVAASGKQLHRRRKREPLGPLRQALVECRESGN